MLYLEESVETILAEEGQDLLGLSFLTETLGLTMRKMDELFRKSALQYSRRRPIQETRTFNSNAGFDMATLVMPEGVRAVKAVRYGVLDEIPRFYMDDFGMLSYEYEEHTRFLKVWPPISPLRVTYVRDLEITKTRKIVGVAPVSEGETYYYTVLPTSPIAHSLNIAIGDFKLSYGNEKTIKSTGVLDDEEQRIIEYTGDLGKATYNASTRELEIDVDEENVEVMNLIKEGTAFTYEYFPKYYILPDISLQDEVFNKLFASKILEALASLRAQSTQEVLHNIDLTTDELYTRVRILKRELSTLLRNTIKFSGMSHI